SYRLKGDCREAATFYKNYLRRVPDAPNNSKVRDRAKERDECAAKQPPPTTTTTTAPQPEAPREPERPEAPPSSGTAWMKYAGYGALGVGAVGFVLGIKFMLDGKAADDELKRTCMVSCTSAEALAIQDDGKAANR